MAKRKVKSEALAAHHMRRRTTKESLFAKCDKSGGESSCWIWKGYVSRRYGIISMNDHPTRAHRAAWILTNGEIPNGMAVCHKCDTPLCCNPSHLWLGTALENNLDCVKKKRNLYGEIHPDAKLTAKEAGEVRRLMKTTTPRAALAERFGISKANLYRIHYGFTWKSLEKETA